MKETNLLSYDLFVTTISDDEGLECFLYPVKLTEDFRYIPTPDWPKIIEDRLPPFLRRKIILEINNGHEIFYKICEYCFDRLAESSGFVCLPCYEKHSKLATK